MTTTGNPGHDPIVGQVVVVTGGGGVIGRAICEAFAQAGALVAVADVADHLAAATVAVLNRLEDAAWLSIST